MCTSICTQGCQDVLESVIAVEAERILSFLWFVIQMSAPLWAPVQVCSPEEVQCEVMDFLRLNLVRNLTELGKDADSRNNFRNSFLCLFGKQTCLLTQKPSSRSCPFGKSYPTSASRGTSSQGW